MSLFCEVLKIQLAVLEDFLESSAANVLLAVMGITIVQIEDRKFNFSILILPDLIKNYEPNDLSRNQTMYLSVVRS